MYVIQQGGNPGLYAWRKTFFQRLFYEAFYFFHTARFTLQIAMAHILIEVAGQKDESLALVIGICYEIGTSAAYGISVFIVV